MFLAKTDMPNSSLSMDAGVWVNQHLSAMCLTTKMFTSWPTKQNRANNLH